MNTKTIALVGVLLSVLASPSFAAGHATLDGAHAQASRVVVRQVGTGTWLDGRGLRSYLLDAQGY